MQTKDAPQDIRQSLDRASQELRILHEISRSITSTLDLDQVLTRIVELVVDVTGGDSCLVYLYDQSDTDPRLYLRASKDPHPDLIGHIGLRVGEGITGWVAENKEPVAIANDAASDQRFKFFNGLHEDTYRAFLSVPIIVPPDRVTGVINVQHRQAHVHSDTVLTMMSIISRQVGGAIQNAQLYAEAERRTAQLTALSEVGQIVASGRYLDEMLRLIVKMISEIMAAPVCSIMLVDQKKNELVLKAAECSSTEYWQRPNLKIGKSLISRVVKERRPLIVDDVTREREYLYPDLAKREGVRSLISLPMMARDRVIGVINVYSGSARIFDEEDMKVLATVCDQAAMAIENTNLAAAVQEREEALEARKQVDRAKSLLQRQLNITEDEAYRRLRQQSMKSRRTMREIAEAVILSYEMAG